MSYRQRNITFNQCQMIERAKLAYSSSRKAFEKQTKIQADALKSLNFSNRINELKKNETMYPQNQMNDLIIDKLKESENNVKLDNLNYATKGGNYYDFR